VGFIRFIVVFLLGIGAAFGAYATGALGHLANYGSVPTWWAASHPVVLRVSGARRNSACESGYTIDNHSSRRVLVLVTPPGEDIRAEDIRTRSADGPPTGYYGSSERETPYGDAPAVRTQTMIPVEVAPGEEKNVGPRDNGPTRDPASAAVARCDDNRLVTLNDCATNESGVCSSASTFSQGGDQNRYQGDQ
jgi:hypothetical protein